MNKAYFNRYHFSSSKFLIAFIITILLGVVLFAGNFINLGFAIYVILTVVLFFYGTEKLPKYFQNLSSSGFVKTIFFYTLFLRLFFVIALYIYFYRHNTSLISFPFNSLLFSPNAADATGYHYVPMFMAADFWNNKLDYSYYLKLTGGLADYGYMLYMFPLYVVFGPHLWLHGLSNLIVGSLSVVLVYKIAKNQYNHEVGVMASVMMMLMPFFYYFSAEALKEMVLIWLSLSCIYYLQNFILDKGRVFKNLILGLLFLLSITLFRTFFAGIIMVAFAFALLLKKKRNRFKTIFFSALAFLILVFLVRFSYVGAELQKTADSSQGIFGKKLGRQTGNALAYQLATIPSYLAFVVTGPFPSFVKIKGQEIIVLNAGGAFVRNFLCFFYIIGIYYMVRSDFRRNLFLIVILTGYLFVLAYSGYASSTRMYMPVIPLILIFSVVGIYKISSKQKKYLVPFLIVMIIVILVWNYIKLAGRGII